MTFVDTSFWVAYRRRRDANHEAARLLLNAHASSGLVTSNHVEGETWTFLRRRAGHAAAAGFLDLLHASPRIQVLRVDAELEADAWSWLRQRADREYSFVDATSFAVMRSLDIRQALAFEGDFSAAGFIELRPA